jgi:hypothetical protein
MVVLETSETQNFMVLFMSYSSLHISSSSRINRPRVCKAVWSQGRVGVGWLGDGSAEGLLTLLYSWFFLASAACPCLVQGLH